MTESARAVPNRDDLSAVEATLCELSDYSNLAAADALGVSEATVRRWRAGNIAVPLRTATRLALRSFLDRSGRQDKSHPTRAEVSAPGEGYGLGNAHDLQVFRSVPHIREYIARIARPGDATARKLDVLEGVRRVLSARNAMPEWWYHLTEDVQRGDL